MTETTTDITALHKAIDRAILMSPRRLTPEDVAEAISDAVRSHLAVECRDGYMIAPEVSAVMTNAGWAVTVDGVRVGGAFEDVRFADFDVSPVA